MSEYNGIYVYVLKKGQIVFVEEGCGDNLLHEDIAEGYVDYVNYTQFEADGDEIEQYDGGMMMMMKEVFRDKYKSTNDAVKDILHFIYYEYDVPYIVLEDFGK